MNIRPDTFQTLARDVAEMRAQLAEMCAMLSRLEKPRDPSIRGFCQRVGISRSTYLNYRNAGKGPVEGRTDGRVFITEESEADWISARQADARRT
jgi:hypothetical protein